MTRVAVTGGAGFIGANFVHHMVRAHPDYDYVVLDKLTYAGNLENLEPVLRNPQVRFVQVDICDPAVEGLVRGCDFVVNFAAESHVDRSIDDATSFVRTNVEGTWRMLESARRSGVRRFVQISTDEVYGSLGPEGRFTEDSPLAPNSPYAATKAAADLQVLAYVRTHRLPAVVTRCSNNYGPYQFPEKFISLLIAQALARGPLPVYGDGRNVRDWIHVSDHCRAIDVILHRGRDGEVYNIGGDCERENIEVAWRIAALTGAPAALIRYVTDRPGHDRRYAMDCSKLKQELDWAPRCGFEEGLAKTIDWYRHHEDWLGRARSGEYRDYFRKDYSGCETQGAASGI